MLVCIVYMQNMMVKQLVCTGIFIKMVLTIALIKKCRQIEVAVAIGTDSVITYVKHCPLPISMKWCICRLLRKKSVEMKMYNC